MTVIICTYIIRVVVTACADYTGGTSYWWRERYKLYSLKNIYAFFGREHIFILINRPIEFKFPTNTIKCQSSSIFRGHNFYEEIVNKRQIFRGGEMMLAHWRHCA